MLANAVRAEAGKEDLMDGAGKFTEAFPTILEPADDDDEKKTEYMYQDKWFIVSPDAYKFNFVAGETAEEQGHIELEKKSGADGFFDDALTYLFLNPLKEGETE